MDDGVGRRMKEERQDLECECPGGASLYIYMHYNYYLWKYTFRFGDFLFPRIPRPRLLPRRSVIAAAVRERSRIPPSLVRQGAGPIIIILTTFPLLLSLSFKKIVVIMEFQVLHSAPLHLRLNRLSPCIFYPKEHDFSRIGLFHEMLVF